ncbi:putative signal transduction protein [Desulfocapsa sulfexigens DSM 10523]|uniref:histidine kinase n=1 Tax=Desulfocapsa sulfexigens (strain DSM 10523 / SB164P1) TaxID=1167006 RepID=M1P5A8_DESSD|nr:HDOD domain-containing protein [Desulfocapsa sulfexigens]AGF78678.1 putative signal transduction protein [Desulfocapsa sulfexigens DSM 10523]
MDNKNPIYARLQKSKHLPSLPQVLLKLVETCDNDEMALSELSEIISKDASICSRVLTLVNSSYFNLNSTVINIDQAVVYLGADTIKNIAITASVQQIFNKFRQNEHLSMERFWWNSLTSAIYAKRIAKEICYENSEEAYLAGLIHNLGELLLWMNFPEECIAIQSKNKNTILQCSKEEEQIGINHCDAGAWLVKQWKLNSLIADAVLYHHTSLEQVKGNPPLVKIVCLADQCCQAGEAGSEDLYEVGRELFDLGSEQVAEICAGVEEETKEVAEGLGIKVSPPSEKASKQFSESRGPERDLQQQVKNYSLLHGFLENLVAAENRDVILKAIEQAINILFDIETVFFFLHDFEQQQLYGRASTLNRYSEQLQKLIFSTEQGKSLLVKSMLEKRSISITQKAEFQMESRVDSQLFDLVGGKGMLYFPMTAQNRSVGVMVFGVDGSTGKELLNESEYDLVQLLANQAAMSLYLDEVKRRHAEKIHEARLDAASMAAAKVVHEVNNPLGIIRNYLKIVEMKLPATGALQDEFTVLDEEITRISMIVQQLDAFSTSNKRTYELIDINDLLSGVLSVLSRSVFYSSNLQVHFMPDPDLPDIMADAGAIKQIAINLLKNAAEAMTDGGNVYVATSSRCMDEFAEFHTADKKSHCIELTIRDDGPGVSEKILGQLFDPFTSTKGKGHSGLGLSVVNSLVTEMNGVVTCRSNRTDGTLFCITLPIRQNSDS